MSDERRVTSLVCDYHTGQTGARESRQPITNTGVERATSREIPYFFKYFSPWSVSITQLTPSSPQNLPTADSARG
jgi:hypothetical protein